MHFTHYMKRPLGAILSLVMMFSLSTAHAAEESACVKSYRKANSDFFKILSKVNTTSTTTKVVGVTGAACAGYFAFSKSFMGTLMCGMGFGAIAGGTFVLSQLQKSDLEKLEGAHLIYQAYFAYQTNDFKESEYVKELMKDLKTESTDPAKVLKELATLMDWGHLCEGERFLSYDEVIKVMTSRLHAPL